MATATAKKRARPKADDWPSGLTGAGTPFWECPSCGHRHLQSVCPEKCGCGHAGNPNQSNSGLTEHPGVNSTTNPIGIAANDPEAVKGIRFRGEIVGPKCFPNEHGLIIDAEIRDLIEPLTPHERGTLKANIERDGCLDPLKGWKETGILLDGHNRKDIAEAHTPDPIPFAVEWLPFPDRQSAIAWVLGNQLGRRNITPEHRAYLIGKRLEHESKPRGGNRKSKAQNEPLNGDTASRIGKETGKSRETVKRNGVFSKAVDRLESAAGADIKSRILAGKVSLDPGAAKAVLAAPPAALRETGRRLREGYTDVRAALPAAARRTAAKPASKRKSGPGPLPKGFRILDPKESAAAREAWQTVVNRLRELRGLVANFKAGLKPVKKLVDEVLAFAESNAG